MSITEDVIIDTAELPAGVTSVWSPADSILIIATTATPEQGAQARAACTDRALPRQPLRGA